MAVCRLLQFESGLSPEPLHLLFSVSIKIQPIAIRSGRVATLVARLNRDGLAALESHGRGGPKPRYDAQARQRIVAEARVRSRARWTGVWWSLMTLRRALYRAPDGLVHGQHLDR